MGEVSLTSASLLSSIASMYDNRLFSDVEFLFTVENGDVSGRMFCHSFVLAIRSQKFASMFFGDSKKKIFHQVELPSSKAPSFSHLVRFLYTDNLELCTFEEAQEVYDLAKQYAVAELEEKCSNYILKDELTMDNIFSKYKNALDRGMHTLLKECQNFVCSHTHLVLKSFDSPSASSDVVKDIVKLDNLSVSTEMEVIGAVLRWGAEELKRRNLALEEKNLRRCIDPLKKHIRFLTLEDEEFEHLIENYEIFSSKESSKLTLKRMDRAGDVVLPDSLSSIVEKRKGNLDSNSTASSVNKTVPQIQSCVEKDNSNAIFHFSAPQPPIPSNDLSLKHLTFEGFLKSSITSALVSSKILTPIANSEASHIPTAPDKNKVSYQVTKISGFDIPSMSRNTLHSNILSPSPRDALYVAGGLSNCRFRDFEFPLEESLPCFRTSFQNDVKSTITFQMVTGKILLHGFEIKVKYQSAIEALDIEVDLKGFSKQPFSKLYKEKLQNNVVCIQFPGKMVLQAGSRGKLEVSIDNLLLNRCCTCNSNKPIELNCGNGFACEMTLDSTQKTESGGSLFLVSKLLYMPC